MEISTLIKQVQQPGTTINDADTARLLFALSTSWRPKTVTKNRVVAFLTGFVLSGSQSSANNSVPYDDTHFINDLDQQIAKLKFPVTLQLTTKETLNGLHFTDDVAAITQLIEASAPASISLQSPSAIRIQ